MIQPAWLKGSGTRIRKGWLGKVQCGSGILEVRKAPAIGIDAHLWSVWQEVVAGTGLHVTIDSCDTGQHAKSSRHYVGCATDTDAIGLPGEVLQPVTAENPHAIKLVQYVLARGWKNHEMGAWPGVLLGPVHTQFNATGAPHVHHIHLSIERP